jgi:hypothetical protein
MAKVWHQCTATGEEPELREHLAWNCHVEILQNVYYNAWIWQLLWFKFCCCICQYIPYITHNKICPLTWHVSSQHHQTSTTKLAMQLNKYFAWFVIYSRRTIWMDGWDHRKTTHDSIHYSSAKVIVHDTKQDVVVGVFEYNLGFDINVCFCLSLFFFHTLEKDSLRDHASNCNEHKIRDIFVPAD